MTRINKQYAHSHCVPPQPLRFSLPVHDSVNGMRYLILYKVGFVLDDFSQL